MTEIRQRIAACVRSHPGIHFNELVRALDLANGQVQYHLDQLQADDRVVEERLYGKTHYYPPDYGAWERTALALLRRETAGDIVALLLAEGPTRPGAVADRLDIARSTVEWHLDRLTTHGIVRKQRDEHDRVIAAVERPEDLVQLLREADPSLPARMVDRFTRLVDLFLSE